MGDHTGMFGTEVTAERHCGVVVLEPLDYEAQQDYTLTVLLEAPEAPPGTENRQAQVRKTSDKEQCTRVSSEITNINQRRLKQTLTLRSYVTLMPFLYLSSPPPHR